MPRTPPVLRRIRRVVLARRRWWAAVLVAVAVTAGLQSQAPDPPPRQSLLVVARDLPGDRPLRPSDVTVAQVSAELVPRGALRSPDQAVGRSPVGPLRAGEPLTDVRVLGPSMLAAHPDRVALAVRIGDAATLALLRVGDRVDLLAADPQRSGPATVAAAAVPVLAIPRSSRDEAGLVSGGLLVVAADQTTALRLAGLGVTKYLSFTLSH